VSVGPFVRSVTNQFDAHIRHSRRYFIAQSHRLCAGYTYRFDFRFDRYSTALRAFDDDRRLTCVWAAAGYVTLTSATYAKQSNARRATVESKSNRSCNRRVLPISSTLTCAGPRRYSITTVAAALGRRCVDNHPAAGHSHEQMTRVGIVGGWVGLGVEPSQFLSRSSQFTFRNVPWWVGVNPKLTHKAALSKCVRYKYVETSSSCYYISITL